jgi:hypothetical protein
MKMLAGKAATITGSGRSAGRTAGSILYLVSPMAGCVNGYVVKINGGWYT